MASEKLPSEAKEPVVSLPSHDGDANTDASTSTDGKSPPPLPAKLFAVFLISCISFGSHWSSGVTGAMKSTIKKQMNVSNTQFSLLEASEDFMATVLLLISGIVTDRVGGAEMIVYGNIVYTIGSILVAAATTVRSFNFMIGGRVILALGDIATQIAQYKMFSSWFPPSNGFASTLGFELAIGKIGGFVGKSTANVIAKNTGNFAWVFWTSVFMNVFTNFATAIFYFFTRYCNKHYTGQQDTATKEVLTEKNKKFELHKIFQLPWMFWVVLLFSLFQTSTALVFSQNATELAEKRFDVDSIKAGWYSSLSQYAGFFLVPVLGVFIDVLGNRASVLCTCGLGIFLSMVLVNFANTKAGTAASFGIYAIAVSFGPTSIVDSIRTTLWHQSVFGAAYALKDEHNRPHHNRRPPRRRQRLLRSRRAGVPLPRCGGGGSGARDPGWVVREREFDAVAVDAQEEDDDWRGASGAPAGVASWDLCGAESGNFDLLLWGAGDACCWWVGCVYLGGCDGE
ncbi:putative MFS transporter [Aspergillus mulundensis]|uniref:Lysosomal dipeptide transporter MFSD1 n=1 Tax=Aspergillus mulundensis TaxID=1810919 RepID=A0A3D8RER2_9EURO|nr:Major facilitator superfamily-containing protein 1 [Aspergillus mulundensis]RDW72418.1 Major facilitator superfamily-containing protein 1 [Aspergillus mulundensis]